MPAMAGTIGVSELMEGPHGGFALMGRQVLPRPACGERGGTNGLNFPTMW
jgi:hypothetical protein